MHLTMMILHNLFNVRQTRNKFKRIIVNVNKKKLTKTIKR